MIKGLIVSCFLTASSMALAQFEIPDDQQVLTHLGDCQQEPLPTRFQLFLWNIKKAEAKSKWVRDFEALAADSDMILLQEAVLDRYVPDTAKKQKGVCWIFATSFFGKNNVPTGVMNGSSILPQKTVFLRSPGREPITQTPKMTLISEFPLANSRESLIVVNTHGLNFVTDRKHREQIEHVADHIRHHQGPMIVAGDFNTWNKDRQRQLDAILTRLNLKKLPIPNDTRSMKLDHIYLRDLSVLSTTLFSEIESSDHKPIKAEFRLN